MLREAAQAKGYATRKQHLFFCTGDSCHPQEKSLELWKWLKAHLKEREPDPSTATMARTKVACLRICGQGPIALVEPAGTLYANLTQEKLERIVEEHLLGGHPVEDLAFHERSLS